VGDGFVEVALAGREAGVPYELVVDAIAARVQTLIW